MASLAFMFFLAFADDTLPSVPVCPEGATLDVVTKFSTAVMSCMADGLYHGRFVTLAGGRLLQDSAFVEGKADGPFRAWDEEGRLTWWSTYERGELVGFELRFAKGNLTKLGYTGATRPPGKGPYRTWTFRSDGTVQRVATYIAPNKLEGREWKYHRDGTLAMQSDWHAGKLSGRTFGWSQNGEFARGACRSGTLPSPPLWETEDYRETLTKPCPPEAQVDGLIPPGDHAVPAPSAATYDVLPDGLDIPGFVLPVPPPLPKVP